MEAWSSSYTVEVWKGFLCRGSAEGCEGCTELVGRIKYHKRFQRHESAKGYTELVGYIKYHKRFLHRGNVELFLHRESVERVLMPWKHRGLYRVGWLHRVP